jgi:D-glycero-alpha-D-manno-heptose-7-phosphate kinase
VSETIITRAPTRIDFGGGWTDVPPYSDEVGGFVCNVAITRYATATVTRTSASDGEPASASTSAGDQSIALAAARRFRLANAHIDVQSDFPAGAGLGGSSAVGVAIVAALAAATGESMERTELAELSRSIEIGDLGVPGGRQDHYAAAYGGALGLRFSHDRVDVRDIPLDAQPRAELERRCIVIYTGQSRISGERRRRPRAARREPRVTTALMERRNRRANGESLTLGDIDALAALVAEQWCTSARFILRSRRR